MISAGSPLAIIRVASLMELSLLERGDGVRQCRALRNAVFCVETVGRFDAPVIREVRRAAVNNFSDELGESCIAPGDATVVVDVVVRGVELAVAGSLQSCFQRHRIRSVVEHTAAIRFKNRVRGLRSVVAQKVLLVVNDEPTQWTQVKQAFVFDSTKRCSPWLINCRTTHLC